MSTELAVRAKLTGRVPAGYTMHDVDRAVKLAARRYRTMTAEQKRKAREGGV